MTEKEQAVRKERAKGLRVIKPDGGDSFLVESSEQGKHYRVRVDGEGKSCTCPDFLNNWSDKDWRCKHIIAVEEVLKMEEKRIFDHEKPKAGLPDLSFNRKLLEQPFEPSQIKQRMGRSGLLDYVEGHAVIKRLNDAFEGNWSFEVVSHEILKESDEIAVLGRLTACGIVKMQFGISQITRDRETKEVISLGDDLKAAATDSLKKCATQFGVGLHLYEERGNQGQAEPLDSEKESREKREDSGRITNRQLATIYGLAKARGLSSQEVERKTIQVFNKRPEYLSKTEASLVITELKGE